MSAVNSAPSSANDPNGAVSYALSVRIDRPVAGCDISPHPYLSLRGGTMDNNTVYICYLFETILICYCFTDKPDLVSLNSVPSSWKPIPTILSTDGAGIIFL